MNVKTRRFAGMLRAMRTLTVSDNLLVIHSPLWMGLVLIAAGIAITVGVFFIKWRREIRLGALLGVVIVLYGGWNLLRNTTTFERRGFYVEGLRGEEQRVGWLQVSGIGKSSSTDELVLNLRSGGELSIDLSGLSADDQAKVTTFVRGRLKPT